MPNFVKVATRDQVQPDQPVCVRVGTTRVALYNVDGEIYATHDICSHGRAHLCEGTLHGHEIECPRHGARFDVRSGKNTRLPAVVPVKSFLVQLDGDDVLVAVN